jgi:hypothetical protein
MNYYHVLIGAKHIDLIRAMSGEHAIQIAIARFGPAKRFSEKDEYRAVRA